MVLACVLDTHNVPDILHDTNQPVIPGPVRADRACLLVGDHPADLAILRLIAQLDDRISEMMDVLLGLSQKVQGKPQRAPLPYPWKGTDRLHGILKKFRRVSLR